MRRSLALLCTVVLISGLLIAPVGAADKLEVVILGQSDLSPTGTFEIYGDAAELLCDTGLIESENTRIEWLSEDTFKIWQDKVLTCNTGEIMVLELKNTIVIGEGGIPGKGTWKLKNSTGFDPAPKGKGDIVALDREAYIGFLSFH